MSWRKYFGNRSLKSSNIGRLKELGLKTVIFSMQLGVEQIDNLLRKTIENANVMKALKL